MIDQGAISEQTLELWPKQQLVVALKSLSGQLYIDLRKWIAVDGRLTARKGIMMSVEHWPKAIDAIQKMLKENT